MIYISIVFLSEELQMDKKKSGKVKSSGKPSTVKPKKSEDPRLQEEDKLDFGGLPDVDLKKNLGCG